MSDAPLPAIMMEHEILPRVVNSPLLLSIVRRLFENFEPWMLVDVEENADSRDVDKVDVLPFMQRLYRIVHRASPGECKHRFRVEVFPAVEKEYREYGLLSVIFCDVDMFFYVDGSWRRATKRQALSGILIAGAMNPIIASTKYKFTSQPSLFVSFSLEPEYSSEECRNAHASLVA